MLGYVKFCISIFFQILLTKMWAVELGLMIWLKRNHPYIRTSTSKYMFLKNLVMKDFHYVGSYMSK